jgi:uncharacterized protein
MKTVKVTENRMIQGIELTAFVREVVLPGSSETVPKLDARFCCFKLKFDRSPIHRWGVFAAEKIPARRRVIEYTGQKINAQETWRRRIRRHLYLFRLNRKWVIDGAIGGSGAEFINHSCNPNLYARAGGGRIFFISHRVIATAEELTLDYNIINNGTDLPCTCGAEKCRGIINRNS